MARYTFQPAPTSYDHDFMATMESEYRDGTPWTRLRLAAVRALVDPHPGDRVLDLGCATGAVTHYLSTLGCTTVGVDAEPLAIERARELFPELEFELADVAELPFGTWAFDKAVAADLVEHVDDDTFARMLAELRRVLIPGGTLSIYTPNRLHLIERLKEREWVLAQNPTHVAVRDAGAIVRLLEAGDFAVERNDWRASHFAGWNLVERSAGRLVPSLRYRLCITARTPA